MVEGRETLYEYPFQEYSSFSERLIDFIERLNDILEAMPPDSRDNAQFEYESSDYDYGGGGKIEINYTRFETDEELAAKSERSKKASEAAKKRAAAAKIAKEKREREEYARLRAKFDNPAHKEGE